MAARSKTENECVNSISYGEVRHSFEEMGTLRHKIGVELFLSVPSGVICMLCRGVMREPIRALDGGSYCRMCYLSKPEFTSLDKIPHYELNIEKAELIASLKCYCWYRGNGCDWLGQKSEWEYHLSICRYFPTNCLFCQESYIKVEESAHRAICPYDVCECGLAFPKRELENHKDECGLYTPCAKCIMSVLNSEFEYHINSCEYTFCQVCKEPFSREQMFQHVNTKIMETKQSGSEHIQRMIEELKTAQNAINLSKLSVLELKKEVEQLKQELAESRAERKDGSLIWKIENVLEKHKLAKADNSPLYSPPFYSHENGYKMGAKLYLNGDGEATEGYISLYFLLYKGKYDDILEWPFQHKVALHLITFGTEKPKIEIFTPEKSSISFERPKSERNIPSGYKRFARQDILEQDTYVKNGNLYIKIVTDTANMHHP